jgi:hypothetical protein
MKPMLKWNSCWADVTPELSKAVGTLTRDHLMYQLAQYDRYETLFLYGYAYEKVFPANVLNALKPDQITSAAILPPGLPPHSDWKLKTSLNFYIEGKGTTKFYEACSFAKPHSWPGKDRDMVYTPNEVKECFGFSVKPGAVVLLDVSAIHSVSLWEEPRTMVQMTWRTDDFNTVLQRIKNL